MSIGDALMSKILFVNQASYKTSDNPHVLEDRKKWIVDGLQSLQKLANHFEKCDSIFMDNTVDSVDELPEEILINIPESFDIVLDSSLNQYGKINSGAGNLEMTRSLLDKFDKYDFYIHHEPRTVIRHSKMFDSFFENPRDYFRIGSCTDAKDMNQFWTGTYFTSTSNLKRFLEWANLDQMCNQRISIEYHIKAFFDTNNTPFDTTTDAGILWHDKQNNETYEV